MRNEIRFKIFEQFPELLCRMVGKPLGIKNGFDENYQIKWERNLIEVTNYFKIQNIRIMYQVHGVHIHECDLSDRNEIIRETDGLFTKKRGIFLTVKIADCMPIFFYEPAIKIIGVAHAGWKGTLQKIAERMVADIVRHGGRAENIFVAIGPYIHNCCYNVAQDRFLRFKEAFCAFNLKKLNFLDLGKICAFQMIKLGVCENHIEISNICTKCNTDRFYSFRAGDRNANNIGIFGMKEI